MDASNSGSECIKFDRSFVMEKALRKTAAVAISLLMFSVLANAQLPKGGTVFFGYSYSGGEAFTYTSSAGVSLNGWDASAEGRFLPWLSGIADFDWHYGGHDFPVCTVTMCTSTLFHLATSRSTLLFGPRASVSFGRYRPFAEVLLGFAHQTDNGGTVSNSDLAFSAAIGGGIDYRLVKGVAWRTKADYLHTSLFGGGQNDVRVSTGIAFRF